MNLRLEIAKLPMNRLVLLLLAMALMAYPPLELSRLIWGHYNLCASDPKFMWEFWGMWAAYLSGATLLIINNKIK